jgi:hypothetical protein
MASLENQLKEAVKSTSLAIQQTPFEHSDKVSQAAVSVSGLQLPVHGIDIPGAVIPMTDLNLQNETDPEGRRILLPCLTINIPAFLETSPEVRQADLVRTLAVLDQFPLNGFQRRQREVYGDALMVQKAWLQGREVPTMDDYDPRDVPESDLVQNIIGDEFFFSDTGFVDYTQTADLIPIKGGVAARKITLARKDPRAFLIVRSLYTPGIHDKLAQTHGSLYPTGFSSDKRAEAVGMSLLIVAATSMEERYSEN